MKKLFAIGVFLAVLFAAVPALAANDVIQWGTVVPGHCATWYGDGRIQDGGTSGCGGGTSFVPGMGLVLSSGSPPILSLAPIANNTVLGNVIGGLAAPVPISQAQLTALINTFTTVFSGAVPVSPGGTTDFLRADGTWAAPSGGGGVPNNFKQTFLASVNFTPGTTTSLTLANPPASMAGMAVYEDGVYLSSEMYSLSGSTLTFTVPIPSSVQVVEVQTGVVTGTINATAIFYTAPGSGAVTQTVAAKLGLMIWGSDYGMLCNGSHNDSPGFAAGLIEAATLNATLVLPGGECILPSNATLANGQRVVGQGKYLTTMDFTAGSGAALSQVGTNFANGAQVENMTIESAGEITVQFGDSSHTVNYADLDQVAFGAGTINLVFNNCSTCRLQNSDFNAGYTVEAINITGPLNPDNLDSWIGPNNYIIGANTTSVNGIVWTSGGGWHIHDNKIITNEFGILFEESVTSGQTSSAQTIQNNSIEGCGVECIAFSNQSSTVGNVTHVIITDNQVNTTVSGAQGIVFSTNARQYMSNVVVNDNQVTTTNGPACIFLDSLINFTAVGNQCNDTGTGTTGIEIDTGASNGIVMSNQIFQYANKVINSGTNVNSTTAANGP